MQVQEHSTVREGLVAGLLGAVTVAVWYLVVDTAAGRPFRTLNALGGVFFRGDANPGAREIVPGLVAGFTLLHVIAFALVGMGLTLVVHLASRHLALRMGLWIGLVVAFCFLAGIAYMLTTSTAERLPAWTVVLGPLLGVVAMGWYLWRRHPRLGSDAPLGAEVKTPRHAPGAPGR
jgi:drug/metabolite transporter (DMT)-like permease